MYKEIGEFLTTFGGWGAAFFLSLAVKKLYTDAKEDAKAHKLEMSAKSKEHEDKMSVLLDKSMATTGAVAGALVANTEQARAMTAELRELQESVDQKRLTT